MTRPPHDDTAVHPVPPMQHHTRPTNPNRPWVPCRHHLFELLRAVDRPHVRDAEWQIPAVMWEQMKREPELNGDWHEQGIHRTLMGLRVHLVQRGLLTVLLTVPVDCQPAR